ncbi:MAG: pyridoxal phosphate-dependent decarboxylase family protein [Phycisphaerae bacterium]
MVNKRETAVSGTLDPSDWQELREIAHAMVDDMIDYVRDVRQRPAWHSPSSDSRALLSAPVPRHGKPLAEVYDEFKQAILPYPTGNIHPRFWGWVMGNGTPVGMLADLLGGAMNCHVSGYDQSATLVEKQVIGWLCEVMDFPSDAGGLLVSGGTVANLVGLVIARNSAFGHGISQTGVARESPVIYASTHVHGWLERSVDLLGFGAQAISTISVDSEHRIDLGALRRSIELDLANGRRPICIVGNAGTVSCGATDDLHALADIAAKFGIWFHIDGAFGALAKLSPRYRSMVDGLERADSIAFDLHKWGYMQYELGVVLVQNAQMQAASFDFSPSYLDKFRGGIAPNPTEFASKGIQLSRGFRALKAWMQFSTYGMDSIGAVIEQNIDQVAYLRQIIAHNPHLEQVGPSAMNVVCFRYVPDGMSDEEIDAFNVELLVRIQEEGVAVPSNARIDGVFALRVAHTNHRSQIEDFDILIEAITRIARAQLSVSG